MQWLETENLNPNNGPEILATVMMVFMIVGGAVIAIGLIYMAFLWIREKMEDYIDYKELQKYKEKMKRESEKRRALLRELEKRPVTYDSEKSILEHGPFKLKLGSFNLEDVICKEIYENEGKTNVLNIEERYGGIVGKNTSKAIRDAVSRINEKAKKKLHLQDKLLSYSREYVTINNKYFS